MKKWLASFVALPLLVGCSSGNEAKQPNEVLDVAALEVKVNILTPEEVAVNEPIELAAHVQQNGEDVNDADSVQFEVWESGYRDQGQMIDGELDSDGLYKAEITFGHDGVYYMYAHTTARDMHVMPIQQIVVGNPDMSQVKEDNSSDSADDMVDHSNHDPAGTEGNHSSTESESEHNH